MAEVPFHFRDVRKLAHLEIIKEAFEVFAETGKSPRELLESPWRPIETAPHDTELLLFVEFSDDPCAVSGHFDSSIGSWMDTAQKCGIDHDIVMAWMPLPVIK